MRGDWVAASVRARSMAQHRVGTAVCLRMASQESLADALSLGPEWIRPVKGGGVSDPGWSARVLDEALLWRLRVLAGWLPPTGTGLVRAAAGVFEIDNVVALAHRLRAGAQMDPPFELGALASAWPRVQAVTSVEELLRVLDGPPWGRLDLDVDDMGLLREVLVLAWWRRLTRVAPAARTWYGMVCVLTAARLRFVEDSGVPSPLLLRFLGPVLGRGWETSGDMPTFAAAVPAHLRGIIADVERPESLWRAEARFGSVVEADGFRLLHHALPGADVVLGALVVLAVDVRRVRAALAAAALGPGAGEVLDVLG